MRAANAEVMVINGTINKDWIRQYGEDIHNVRELYISKDVKKIEPDMLAVLDNLTTIVVDEDNPYYDSRDNCNAVIDSQTNELIIGCHENCYSGRDNGNRCICILWKKWFKEYNYSI